MNIHPCPQVAVAVLVPVERNTLEQVAELLELLEQWLSRAYRGAVEDCAHTCSRGATDDPDEVAAAVGLLADQLYTHIAAAPSAAIPDAEVSSSWS